MAGKRINSRLTHKQREEFFEEGRLLDADPETRELAACWMDGDRIDYDAAPGSTPNSHNLDHYYPVEDYPELQNDPDNFRHAHADCNARRGKGAPSSVDGLGEPMPAWW